VSELAATSSSPPFPALDAIAETAWALEPPQPWEMSSIRRDDAAKLLDGLLGRVARGRGALDVAIGDGLASLAAGDRTLRLGYSSVGDYAVERLGIQKSTAEKMARLALALRERPLLRDAVWRGEVSVRKAEAVLRVARGDAEAEWVARARVGTVRALQADAKATAAAALAAAPGGGDETGEDEEWTRVVVPLSPQQRARVDEAVALARKLLGATAPRWQCLEALCTEYLGAHPVEVPEESEARGRAESTADEQDKLKAWLESQTRQWELLETFEPVAAPGSPGADPRADPFRLDEDLRRLASMRDRWDEVFGHLAMLLRMCGLWRDMMFASFAHYCAERLGMAARTVDQRIALQRKLHELPALRDAMRDGSVSYEKARLVARAATGKTLDAWIERARRLPCAALRREVEANDDAQMCARGDLDLRMPRRVATLLGAAIQAVREASGDRLAPGACLERLATHFIETWGPVLRERNTVQKRVRERDLGRCQVPGCSRPASHVHHVLYRSAGGGDEGENLVALCAAHHLHCVHLGWIRVRGRAPDGLTWELGVRPGAPPLLVVGPAAARA
jgi:hypothetical protein